MWLRKRAQNFLSPNSGHTRCPSLPPIRVNSHHHRASTAATTTSRVNGQPRVVPIYQVCFVFVFFLSTNAIITSSSTRVHPHPPPAPIRAHPRSSPVAPTRAPPVYSPASKASTTTHVEPVRFRHGGTAGLGHRKLRGCSHGSLRGSLHQARRPSRQLSCKASGCR